MRRRGRRASFSANYRAGYAFITDSSSLDNHARQMSAILNYDVSKRTRLYAVVSRLNNYNSAQFKMTGASITTGSLLTPDGGQNETGVQFGIRHLF